MHELESYFKGLSEAIRLRIMNLLLQGELCVCDIQRILNLTQPSASRHLNYLKHAGLVRDRREGLRVFYRLQEGAPELRSLFEFLRGAFTGKSPFDGDLRLLSDSVAKGTCAAPPARKAEKPAVAYDG